MNTQPKLNDAQVGEACGVRKLSAEEPRLRLNFREVTHGDELKTNPRRPSGPPGKR
jgi:hypothetical protein